jgi:hypothetical protein
VKEKLALIKKFCLIQLQILMDREMRLRKELQDCKIQKEYLQQIINEIDED